MRTDTAMKAVGTLVLCVVTTAFGERMEIPFGRGWKWHRGDAPDGPGFGSGALSGFVPRADCTNLVEHNEWAPAGDKEAGQPYSPCGVACSYDTECTAYHRSPGGCYHGTTNTTCSGTTGQFLQRGTAGFQRNFSFARSGFDDRVWPVVTLPHDPLINQTFNESAGEGAAFLPRVVVWYRKRFTLPEEAKGKHIFIYFEGAFQYSEVYLNGEHLQDHASGYTTWTARLDNASSLVYGDGSTNVLSIRVDPSFGSGHWYEGGGINRPLKLVIAPMLHFVQGGLFPNPNSDGTALRVSAEIEDLGAGGQDSKRVAHTVAYSLRDETGAVVATGSHEVDGVGTTVLTPAEPLATWSPQTPVTYLLTANVGDDELNSTVAVRTFSTGDKAKLNGHKIELQGFSHHPSFAGMGAMTNPRLGLFLVQTSKALGVNFWRNSHNPYEDAVYELLTAVGLMCWDENRNFATWHANEYHDMIKAHRGHGSVMIWGLCNEAQCGVQNGTAAEAYMQVKRSLDPDRPQTGNFVHGQQYNFPHVDIIAESGTAELASWHAEFPETPTTGGEHGFGNNVLYYSRSPMDRALPRLGSNVSQTFGGNVSSSTGWGDLKPKETAPFLLSSHGLGMWAMMDYYGEAFMGWPTVIKSRGHLDVAGFPRSTAWWYRTNYLGNTNVTQYQRPLVGGDNTPIIRAMTPCQIFASTAQAVVWVDGTPHGPLSVQTDFGILDLRTGGNGWPPPGVGPNPCTIRLLKQDSTATCSQASGSFGCYDGINGMWVDKGCRGDFLVDGHNVSCACRGTQGYCSGRGNCSAVPPGCPFDGASNVTAVALDGNGRSVASHTLLADGAAARMELVIDVPSVITGTGSAMYLDGQDVAFIRVQLVDSAGTLSRDSDANVTFQVVSGPITIVGVGSGAIANHQPVHGHTYETWQGLGRVVIQATVDCTGKHRQVAQAIDVVAGAAAYADKCPTEPAVLRATSTTGFTATIKIPISGAPEDHPLAVAHATRSLDTYTYFEDVQP